MKHAQRLTIDRNTKREPQANGGLIVRDCVISRAIISQYYGDEMPDGFENGKVYNVYRDADALKAAAPSFEGKIFYNDHRFTTAETINKDEIIGTITNVRYNDQDKTLRADLHFWDGKAIGLVEDGKVELSCGYSNDLDPTPGKTQDGQAYDARMTNIIGDHLALVDSGRVPGAKVADSKMEKSKMSNQSLVALFKRVLFDALAPNAGKTKDTKPINIGEIVGAVSVKTADADIKRIVAAIGDSGNDVVAAQLTLAATAADADPEEKEEKEKAADTDDPDKEKAADMEPDEEKDKKTGDSKKVKLMDSATVQRLIDSNTQKILADQRDLRQAMIECRTLIGDSVANYESGNEIRRAALKHAGIDASRVSDSEALKAMVTQQIQYNQSQDSRVIGNPSTSIVDHDAAKNLAAKYGINLGA